MSPNSHISNLHLFAKDTDAVESIRGFKFQELKALEIWLNNKIGNINERVYLDYEEDVFQRNLQEYTAVFTQLKLYSSKNFSFSSVEIKKALAHFFTLYTKGEYLFDTPQFIFETNNEVARTHTDNDAELLREWSEATVPISGELLTRCVTKLKQIVGGYIDERFAELTTGTEPSAELTAAKAVYDSLPNETWEAFAKSIRWKFSGIPPEETIQNLILSCRELIKSLPFPISDEESSLVFDKLRGLISDTIINTDPAQRFVDNSKMNFALQFLGDDDDKTYNRSYEIWQGTTDIDNFHVGEFYDVLFAARHCRRQPYLHSHTDLWLVLLEKYLSLTIPDRCRREAIYEYSWLTMRPSIGQILSQRTDAIDDLLREYFSSIGSWDETLILEENLNLLSIVTTYSKLGLSTITETEITSFIDTFESRIQALISSTSDPNKKCSYHEQLGFLYFNKSIWNRLQSEFDNALNQFDLILETAASAPLYPISQLGRRIDSIIKLLLQDEHIDISTLEDFAERLLPMVLSRESNFSAAKRYVQFGVVCLDSSEPKKMGKALEHFHKAKDLFYTQDTYEGYILSVLNISQLYSALGFQFAAKYYALAAYWFALNNGNAAFIKRACQAFALILHYDFTQGSWITALSDFEVLISARTALSTDGIDGEDELLMKPLTEVALILHAAPLISNQLATYIECEKHKMGELFTETLSPVVAECSRIVTDLNSVLQRKLVQSAINDIGSNRILKWQAFGGVWEIRFANDFLHNSVAEEFCALIQVFIADITLSGLDFHLLKDNVVININITTEVRQPERITGSSYAWNVYLPVLTEQNGTAVSLHYGKITASLKVILEELSLLPLDKFNELFEALFQSGLGNRAMVINAYQIMLRRVYDETAFNDSRRNAFNSEVLEVPLGSNPLFKWTDSLSAMHDSERVKEQIRNRYRNCLKAIHLSLARIKVNPDYSGKIESLREAGWLDWQITLALFNNILDKKAKIIVDRSGATHTEQTWVAHFNQEFERIRRLDETECDIEIPFEELFGDDLEFQLKMVCIHTLNSYGLENKSRFLNLTATQEFLESRFAFNVDVDVESPL